MVNRWMKPDADPILMVSPAQYERMNLKDEPPAYEYPVVVDGLNHHDFGPDPEAA